MNCDDARAALLEGGRSPEAQRHLLGCPACAAFSESVSVAEGLLGVTPSAPRPARARVVTRGAAVLLVLGVGAAALSLSGRGREAKEVAELAPAEAQAVLPETAAVLAPAEVEREPDAAAEWRALVGLRDAVAFESRRDVRVVDAAYVSFGALPAWVAPAAPRPMRSLGVKMPPVAFTSEE